MFLIIKHSIILSTKAYQLFFNCCRLTALIYTLTHKNIFMKFIITLYKSYLQISVWIVVTSMSKQKILNLPISFTNSIVLIKIFCFIDFIIHERDGESTFICMCCDHLFPFKINHFLPRNLDFFFIHIAVSCFYPVENICKFCYFCLVIFITYDCPKIFFRGITDAEYFYIKIL